MKRLSIIWLISLLICACTNSPKDGEHQSFYEDGTIKRSFSYDNGKLHGEDKFYYPSGNLYTERQWNYDTLIYDQFFYFDTIVSYVQSNNRGDTTIVESPKVKGYWFANNSGVIAYKVHYDEDGKITEREGNPIVSRFMEPVPAKINNRYNLHYRIATQPFIDQREFIVKLIYDKKVIDTTILEIDPNYNLTKYSFLPKDTGIHLVRAIYKQDGYNGMQIDTVDLEISTEL